MTDAEKVRLLRKELNMKQGDFSREISTTQGHISDIENGRKNLSNRTKQLICLKSWNGKYVNKKWLDTGEGNIFHDIPPEDEVASAVSEVLEDIQCENVMYTLIKEFLINYQKSDSKTKEVLDTYLNNVLEGYQKRKEGD